MAKERVGIMGGSFNPIHKRHLEIAECALKEGSLSRVLFIPTGNPPHKHSGLAPAEQRFEMTRLALMGKHYLIPSRIELDRSGMIYTVDTLSQLHTQFINAEFFYIIGEDTLLDLPNWRSPNKVFSLCSFLVCSRSTPDITRHPLYGQLLARGASIRQLSLPPMDISATAIREALAEGLEPDSLPPQVLEYIHIMGLYGISPSPENGEKIYPILRQALSDRRLSHSIFTAYAARQLARRHQLNEDAAALAGILHDCAKCMTLPQLQTIAKEHRLLLDKETMQSANLLHGPVGAVLAESTYGVHNPNVLSAIACHTMGKVGMLPLDMVLYLADKIEPSRRSYPALEETRILANVSLIAAMHQSLLSTIDYLSSQKISPHATTKRVADWLGRLEAQENQRSE